MTYTLGRDAISEQVIESNKPQHWTPVPGSFPVGADGGWRLLSLDVLRGVAILLVLIGHVQWRMPNNALGARVWDALRQSAVVGVDFFLVLSGFLIGGMLLNEQKNDGRISLGRFFARRFLRLWPAYFAAILFGWQWYHHIRIMHNGSIVRGVALWEMWPFFAHVQNYYNVAENNFGAGAVMQTWTIAALVQFYVVVALLLWILAAIGSRAIKLLPLVIVAIFVACFYMRWRVAPIDGLSPNDPRSYDAWRNYFPTHLRLDEPMFGVLLAYLVVHARSSLENIMRKGWPIVALIGLAMTMPTALRKEEGPRFLCIWGFTLSGVGSGLILLCAWWAEQFRIRAAAENPQARPGVGGLFARGIAWLGVWSYSIYLWHQPFVEFLGNKARDIIGNHVIRWSNPLCYPASVAAFVLMSIAFGAFMYYVIELPSLVLRERLMRREQKQLRPVPSFTVAAVAPVQ